MWTDYDAAAERIVITRSDDRGETWTAPQPVDVAVPAGATQYQPTIAVNRDGVVGVGWFDTREATGRGYRQFFAASVDGGVSFLKPVAAASAVSTPDGPGNLQINPHAWLADGGVVRIPFLSPFSRWSQGGDYMGLAAMADGTFYPFWADSRTGTYQAWGAQIRVEDAAGSTPRGDAAPDVVDLSTQVEVIADPARYDAASGELVCRSDCRTCRRSRSAVPYVSRCSDLAAGSVRSSAIARP